jgi:hypothetical protein
LIALRSHSDPGTKDLMWPVITDGLLIRLEPGEVVRWRGTAMVGEVRLESRDGADRPHRAWRLTNADVLITDRRLTYRGHDLERCTCRLAAAVAHLDQPRPAASSFVLAGHVRFQWPLRISLAPVSGQDMWGIVCRCMEDDKYVSLTIGIDDQTVGAPAETIAAEVAAGLVSDIARFRLSAQARTLKRDQIRQLAAQRDNPGPDSEKDSGNREWAMVAAVPVGKAAHIREREDPLCQQAVAAIERYQAGGDPTLLDLAIRFAEDAGKHPSASAFDEILYQNLIGGALKFRYQRYGDLSDLSRCVDTQRAIADRVLSEAPELAAGTFNNLGIALIERFQQALEDNDLADGVAAHEQAVAATDRTADEFPEYLDGLGLALKARFLSKRDATDLDRAIAAHEQALAGSPSRSPDAAAIMVNLGNALTLRFDAAGHIGDLSRAVSVGHDAVRRMGRKSPDRAMALLSLALSAGKLHEAGGDRAHLRAAVDAWREGCRRARDVDPGAVLQGAVHWASAMLKCGQWTTALEACQVGLSTADRLYQRQRAREDKDTRLEEASDLSGLAAYALGRLGRLRDAAVALERGRAVFLYESRDDFRDPPSYADVAAAAAGTCLAYITATCAGGFALLADGRAGGDPRLSVEWLDGLTDSAAVEMGEEFRERFLPAFLEGDNRQCQPSMDSVARRLWDLAIGPVLACQPGDRLVLIPAGAFLDLLPLHAAWTQPPGKATRRYAIDEALITYAPSARLLRAVRSRPTRLATGILAVYDPDLLNSAGEARDARGWFESGAVLSKKQVTCGSLRDALPAHSVLHFACHGFADLATPLDSGLATASDSPLTLRDILGTPLNARLCVLSACDSAIAGGFVPDQVLSLPAGFLLAGAEGVVGTLWPVGDYHARVLLGEFYKLWQEQGIEPAEALRQAQARGRAPDGRSDANWAAFLYMGA